MIIKIEKNIGKHSGEAWLLHSSIATKTAGKRYVFTSAFSYVLQHELTCHSLHWSEPREVKYLRSASLSGITLEHAPSRRAASFIDDARSRLTEISPALKSARNLFMVIPEIDFPFHFHELYLYLCCKATK